MLNQLFGSEIRVKILNLLLLHPDQKYQLRELARNLKLPANSARRELANLLDFGVIKAENVQEAGANKKTSEKKYFSSQADFILYPELRALLAKAQLLCGQKFVNELKKICQPKFLALTGIFTNDVEVKTDLLFVGQVAHNAFLSLIKDLESRLGREVNFTIMKPAEFEYRQKVMDIFLYSVLEGKTIVLIDNLNKKPV